MPGTKRKLVPESDEIKSEDHEMLGQVVHYLDGRHHKQSTTMKNIFALYKPTQQWIPNKFPVAIDQKGPCCGIYQFWISQNYANPNVSLPPPRKLGQKGIISIRQVAKEKNLTALGEIFSAHAYQELATHFKLDAGEVFKTPPDFDQFTIDLICKITKFNTLLTPCDLGYKSQFPGVSRGDRTHWALIFGFILDYEHKCHFLVTQYGAYYLWSAKDLYASNMQLPMRNPKSAPSFFNEKKSKARNPIKDNLTQFRFTFYAVQTPALKDHYAPNFLLLSQVSAQSKGLESTKGDPAKGESRVKIR